MSDVPMVMEFNTARCPHCNKPMVLVMARGGPTWICECGKRLWRMPRPWARVARAFRNGRAA
jgi:hypothetical protein